MAEPINDAALNALFRTARSYNGYVDGAVSEADIHAIYDLIKMAPTSANQQSGRFVWCLSTGAKERLAACATGNNPDKIRTAPAVVVVAYDTEFHEHLPELFPHAPEAKNWFAEDEARHRAGLLNATLQAGYFIMAARALGWDTGPMTGFDAAKLDAEFFGGTTYRSVMISTFGHGDPASIFGRLPRPGFNKFNQLL